MEARRAEAAHEIPVRAVVEAVFPREDPGAVGQRLFDILRAALGDFGLGHDRDGARGQGDRRAGLGDPAVEGYGIAEERVLEIALDGDRVELNVLRRGRKGRHQGADGYRGAPKQHVPSPVLM